MNLSEEDMEDITDMVIDSRDIEAEPTADEMFEKLGYRKEKRYTNAITYFNCDEDYEISFDLDLKTIDIDMFGGEISVKELKAINKKVEELRLDLEDFWKYVIQEIKNGKVIIHNIETDKEGNTIIGYIRKI